MSNSLSIFNFLIGVCFALVMLYTTVLLMYALVLYLALRNLPHLLTEDDETLRTEHHHGYVADVNFRVVASLSSQPRVRPIQPREDDFEWRKRPASSKFDWKRLNLRGGGGSQEGREDREEEPSEASSSTVDVEDQAQDWHNWALDPEARRFHREHDHNGKRIAKQGDTKKGGKGRGKKGKGNTGKSKRKGTGKDQDPQV